VSSRWRGEGKQKGKTRGGGGKRGKRESRGRYLPHNAKIETEMHQGRGTFNQRLSRKKTTEKKEKDKPRSKGYMSESNRTKQSRGYTHLRDEKKRRQPEEEQNMGKGGWEAKGKLKRRGE